MLNMIQALQARFIGRSRYGGLRRSAASLDYANANGFPEIWRDATDAYDIHGVVIDGQNNLRIGNAFVNPARKPITFNVPLNASLQAATRFFICPPGHNLSLTDIFEVHATAGSDAGAVTLTITRETAGQAPGTGSVLITGTINLKGTANTVQTATLAYNYKRYELGSRDLGSIAMAPGDMLSVSITGVKTALAGLQITAFAQPGLIVPHACYLGTVNGDLKTQYFYGPALEPKTVSSVSIAYQAKGTDASAVTIDITKDTSTTAAGGGTSILAAAVSLKGTIDTVNNPALAASAATLALAPGDRLAVKFTGTLTAVAGVVVCVYFATGSCLTNEISFSVGQAASQGTDLTLFTADRLYEVLEISEIHDVANGATLKGLFTIDTGTTAPGAGIALQTDNGSTGFDLNATARTAQYATMAARHARILKRGDRIGFKHSTTMTSLAGLCGTVALRPM